MLETIVGRRIAGTASLLLVLALVGLGFNMRFAPAAGSINVNLSVPQAGIGLQPGTDVKVRGVKVGQVVSVDLDDEGRPLVALRLDPGTQIPANDLTIIVTPKTFFGEKQIELIHPLEAFGQPPFLQDGDTVVSERTVTEVEDVLVTLEPLLTGIDADDLATLFEALAALEGEGDRIAESLEVTAELARFGVEITDDVFRNARLLTSLARQLEGGAAAFDRMNRTLPPAVAILSERQAEIDTNLKALASFAMTTAAWVSTDRDRFERFLATGDIVGAFLERNVDQIPSIVEGIAIFAEVQSRPAPWMNDNSTYVPFKMFFDLRDEDSPFADIFAELMGASQGGG